MIAIVIKNAERIEKTFGECAGDYARAGVRYWVGTPSELYPVRDIPAGVKIVSAPVRFCGGGAWIPGRVRVNVPSPYGTQFHYVPACDGDIAKLKREYRFGQRHYGKALWKPRLP